MRRGPLYMTVAGLVFTGMLALVKVTRAELGAFDVVFWRGITAASLAYVLARGAPGGVRVHRAGLVALRTALGFGAMSCSFAAAGGLAVADLLLIAKLQPLVIALLAPVLLDARERAGTLIWLLLVAGLGGCALLLAPDLAMGSLFGLVALVGAMLAAVAKVCVRGLMRTDDARVVVFFFQAGAMALAAGALLITEGRLPVMPPAHLWPHLLGIGLTATTGQVLMHRAYALDRASVVAAATYTAPLWGVLADVAIFAILPGWNVIAGGLLIVGAGVLLVFLPGGAAAADVPAEPEDPVIARQACGDSAS